MADTLPDPIRTIAASPSVTSAAAEAPGEEDAMGEDPCAAVAEHVERGRARLERSLPVLGDSRYASGMSIVDQGQREPLTFETARTREVDGVLFVDDEDALELAEQTIAQERTFLERLAKR